MATLKDLFEAADQLAMRLEDIGRPATKEEVVAWIIEAGIEQAKRNVEMLAS